MKKLVLFAAVAALVLASCAKTETYVKVVDDDAISFGAYSGRTITKAGPTDDMTLANLASDGFGVFATYSGTDPFSEATDDFMFNQQVTSAASPYTEWTYAPIKYWPNPTNGTAANDQKVSFFAYAPYATSTNWTAETTGITGFSIDDTTKHNLVHYGFDPDDANVDLMWGYKEKDNTDPTNVTYTVNTNLTRTVDKVSFIFKHVLSKLGGSQEGDPAVVGANGVIIKTTPEVMATNDFGTAEGTKINVKEIIIKSAPAGTFDINGNPISYATGVQNGTLDLYTGKFTLESAAQNIQFNQEISATPTGDQSEIADNLKEPGLNTAWASIPTGVTTTSVNVYENEKNPIILVPGSAPVMDVIVEYVVRTYDEKIPTLGYSQVTQRVAGQVKFPVIEENKKYNLLIVIGLESVKFTATVEDWDSSRADTNGDGNIDEKDDVDVWVPNNLLDFALNATNVNVTVDANGDGETVEIYKAAPGAVAITGIKVKNGDTFDDFDNSANNITLNTTTRKIVLDNVAAGTYKITIKADGDEKHEEEIETFTLNVTNA